MENIAHFLRSLNPFWVYFAIGGIAFIENIFPPFPSDVVVVAAGSLIALNRIDFLFALLLATSGSTLGFMVMYKIGEWFGDRVIEQKRLRFLSLEKIHVVEAWFNKYGYGVVIVNRFLAGTRAVISLFAGISHLSLTKTTVFSFFSSLVWYFILLIAGYELGDNWQRISGYLETYGKFMTFIVILIIVIYLVIVSLKNRAAKRNKQGTD